MRNSKRADQDQLASTAEVYSLPGRPAVWGWNHPTVQSPTHDIPCWLSAEIPAGDVARTPTQGLSLWPGLPHNKVAGLQRQCQESDRARRTIYSLLQPGLRSHTVSLLPQSTHCLFVPRNEGTGNGCQLFLGGWQNSGRVCETENIALANFGRYNLPHARSFREKVNTMRTGSTRELWLSH